MEGVYCSNTLLTNHMPGVVTSCRLVGLTRDEEIADRVNHIHSSI
jgi:hypothetical protein